MRNRRYLGGALVTAASVLLRIAVHADSGGRDPGGAPAAESVVDGNGYVHVRRTIVAASVGRGRRARGIKPNYPESIALISDFVLEGARDGKSVAELMSESDKILTRAEVMEGIAEMIPEMIPEMQVEATFPDVTNLAPIHNPIR